MEAREDSVPDLDEIEAERMTLTEALRRQTLLVDLLRLKSEVWTAPG